MGPIKLKFRAPYAKKVHQIEKNTTPPVVAVVANTSYVLTNLSFFVFGIVILINLFFLSLSLSSWPIYNFRLCHCYFVFVIIILTNLSFYHRHHQTYIFHRRYHHRN